MTEPIFYCYDNECGFEEHRVFERAKDNADEMLDLVDEFTEDTDIHCGIFIQFSRLVEVNRRDEPEDDEERRHWERMGWSYVSSHTIEDTTADDVRESIQELDKRGLNTTANELREKLKLADESAREYAGEVVRLKAALMDAEDALVSCDNPTDGEIDDVIAIIKKALSES